MNSNEKIEKILSTLPEKPGVYLMRSSEGAVIYVGKAKNLKNRVRSYFSKSHGHDLKTEVMVSNISDLEYIITDTEREAFILENSLIKKHRPRYNVMYKDDKTYPFIKLTTGEEFPRLILARKILRDKGEYFGPYPDQWIVRVIIRLAQDVFNIRSCALNLTTPKKRACLQFFIGRCKAPCTRNITNDEYSELIKTVRRFLRGEYDEVIDQLEDRMDELSAGFKFEQAGKIRDQIASIKNMAGKQNIVFSDLADRDVIAAAEGKILCAIEMFNVRNGSLLGHKTFVVEEERLLMENVLEDFVSRYYQDAESIPDEIITTSPIPHETAEMLVDYLKNKYGKKVRISTPANAEQGDLASTAHRNALNTLKIKEMEKVEKDSKSKIALAEIASALKLKAAPERIECYDISNISGTLAVGSMVVAIDGAMARSEYRKFKIRTVTSIDDYKMMKEVLTRRFKRAIAEEQKLPDLVMIDGGTGHLSAACEVISELGLNKKVELCSIAKQNEDIFRPAAILPAPLGKKSQGLFLLMRIRDEAHRFAITYHKTLRKGRMTLSILSGIKGLGKSRIAALYDHFETIERIRVAGIDELKLVKSISAPLAKAVYDFFHEEHAI